MFFQDEKTPSTYYLIDTPRKLSWLRGELLEAKELSYDIESNSPTTNSKKRSRLWGNNTTEKVVGMSFSWGRESFPDPWTPGRAAYVPLYNAKEELFWNERHDVVLGILKEILENPEPLKIDHNGKYDEGTLLRILGIRVTNANFDTMLAHACLDEEGRECSHALKSDYDKSGKMTKKGLSDGYLNLGSSHFKQDLNDALAFYDPNYKRYSKVPLDILYPYGCADSDFTLCLKYKFEELMENEGTLWIFQNLIMPLRRTLIDAELHGVPLDVGQAEKVRDEQMAIADTVAEDVYRIVGRRFNINSDKELGSILYEELGLPPSYTEHGGYATSTDVLKNLNHEVIDPLVQHSRATQIHNNYAVSCLERVQDVSNGVGWIHADYIQESRTGRLRLKNPNLTTLPRPENGGLIVKSMFAGDKDYRLIFKDFSQIELRVAAHLSQEPVWLNAFRSGYDMHAAMAHQLNNLSCPIEEVKTLYPNLRSDAKAVNFGIIYGETAYGLAQNLGISVQRAERIIEEYFQAAPTLKKWIDSVHEFARLYGYVNNLFGRRRHIPEALEEDPKIMRWPARENRPGCYRNGPYPMWLGISKEEMYQLSDDELRRRIQSDSRATFNRCISCPYLKSCMVNREAKYIRGKINYAMRQSVNSPIQGSAVDMCSLSMVWSGQEFKKQRLRATPILHLHDEICVYAHKHDVEQACRIMDYYMTDYLHQFTNFSVPLLVDTEVVYRWSDKHAGGD